MTYRPLTPTEQRIRQQRAMRDIVTRTHAPHAEWHFEGYTPPLATTPRTRKKRNAGRQNEWKLHAVSLGGYFLALVALAASR